MSKKIFISIGVVIVVLIFICVSLVFVNENQEIKTIKTEGELNRIYDDYYGDDENILRYILGAPFYIFERIF